MRARITGAAARLRRIHWPTLVFALLLFATGLLAIHEAEVFEERPFRSTFVFRQIVWGGLAAAALVVTLVPHFRFFERAALPLYGLGVFLLVAVVFYGVAKNNSKRWLDLQFMLLQPSEPMKIALALAVARTLRHANLDGILAYVRAGLLAAVPFVLVLRQPDLGTALLLLAIPLALVFLGGLGWRWLLALLVVATLAAPLAYQHGLKPYQRKRITAFLHPDRDPTGANYQLTESLTAIGAGRAGGSRDPDLLYSVLRRVPERHTDFVFSVIGAKFGFVGSAAVVVLFASLVTCLFGIAMRARDPFGKLVAAGIATFLGLQGLLNLAMTIGLAPITGVPLPLVSYGGSSLVTTAVALGLALNVSMRPKRS